MSYVRVNTPGVVHEAIDGEVVIVNLDNGLYFSADGTAAAVWTRLAAGDSVADVATWLEATYGTDDPVADHVDEFVIQLVDNGLVTRTDDAPTGLDIERTEPAATYAKPTLEIYSDMEELLLLDPIHDASDDAGWPHMPT